MRWARIVEAAVIAIVAAVVALVALLFLAPLVHIRSAQDLSGILVTVGGLMGAIFTVGGLVIALAAVLTVLTIEDRVKRTFEDQLPALEKRADRQIEGYITLLRAENAPDWTTAEILTEKALSTYPDLPRARSTLGLRMANAVIDTFDLEHGTSKLHMELDPISIGRPPRDRAIVWLERALEHHDDPDGQTLAALALMFGASQQYDHMMRLIRRVCTSAPTDRLDTLRKPPQLGMLVYACNVDEERLRELSDTLKTPLPIPSRDVLASIESLDLSNASTATSLSPCVDCLVTGRLREWSPRDIGWFPVLVRIFVTVDAHNQRQAQLAFPGPPLHDHADIFTSSPARPAREILADLEALVLFVSQTPRP